MIVNVPVQVTKPYRHDDAAVIAGYPEVAHVRGVAERVRAELDRVLVLDDGSSDATAESAREGGAEVIAHPENRGKGEAIKTGLRHWLAQPEIESRLRAAGAHGGLSGVRGSRRSAPKALGKSLAARRGCQECVVRQLFRYGWGRHELGVDRPVIQAALQRFRDSQFRFKELMISLVSAYAPAN